MSLNWKFFYPFETFQAPFLSAKISCGGPGVQNPRLRTPPRAAAYGTSHSSSSRSGPIAVQSARMRAMRLSPQVRKTM